jgi:hypothetical protein
MWAERKRRLKRKVSYNIDFFSLCGHWHTFILCYLFQFRNRKRNSTMIFPPVNIILFIFLSVVMRNFHIIVDKVHCQIHRQVLWHSLRKNYEYKILARIFAWMIFVLEFEEKEEILLEILFSLWFIHSLVNF